MFHEILSFIGFLTFVMFTSIIPGLLLGVCATWLLDVARKKKYNTLKNYSGRSDWV
ncbi:MAG: hypothetical protein ACW99U_21475 [Candidatus Thorarchaeota archaeon]|jgi:hypothetical protein